MMDIILDYAEMIALLESVVNFEEVSVAIDNVEITATNKEHFKQFSDNILTELNLDNINHEQAISHINSYQT